ncbi:MAG: class I SAM-dependent rRNA methyltransferase [Treponema sp.]|jgi:23S rRNA (cytosine1962-C5)-methyltransferase|nr:class I SAM-dependent rRNA methyltransferase [Treponema sp.]
MKRIILKRGEEIRIRAGHPWVYDNEIDKVVLPGPAGNAAHLECGETVDVESFRKEYLGRAFANPASKIAARICTPSKDGIDEGFFKRRIRQALERRVFAGLGPLRESFRLVFGEADFLPGLIIDCFTGWPALEAEALPERPLRFESAAAALGPPRACLAVQFLCAGVELRRAMILEAIKQVFEGGAGPGGFPCPLPRLECIIERSAAKAREREGLPPSEGLIEGTLPQGGLLIFENGLPFAADLGEGQKTGHFLDQRETKALAGAWAGAIFRERGSLRFLDAFSYTGGFGIHSCRGALHLAGQINRESDADVKGLCVDSSAPALACLKRNAAFNGVTSRIDAVESDVFTFLSSAVRQKERFDMIILDPPAFAKTRSSLAAALSGYKEINLRALSLLRRGGVLVTCSCSQALDEAGFRAMLKDAADDAERRLQYLAFLSQPADHPILAGYDESHYLKCAFCHVLY